MLVIGSQRRLFPHGFRRLKRDAHPINTAMKLHKTSVNKGNRKLPTDSDINVSLSLFKSQNLVVHVAQFQYGRYHAAGGGSPVLPGGLRLCHHHATSMDCTAEDTAGGGTLFTYRTGPPKDS